VGAVISPSRSNVSWARSASHCSTVTCICASSCGKAGSMAATWSAKSGWSSASGEKAMPAAVKAASMSRVTYGWRSPVSTARWKPSQRAQVL